MIGSATWYRFRTHKWALLLFAILILLVISPVGDIFDEQDNVISPLMSLIIVAVIFDTARNARTAWLLTLLTAVWLVIGIATEGSGLFAGKSLLAPVLFMIIIVSIFVLLARWMLRAIFINSEVLCAAICGYLLLGILWTGLYAVATFADAHALVSTLNGKVVLGDMLYFSFTTLTTTGFGDIVPRNPVVRMLAVVEAIVGIFYNTIVIARFVSLYGIKPHGAADSIK